jgi:alkylation response protein AidB-like acyl-CoA dehydrogenase
VAARECWNSLSRARRWWRLVDGSVQFCLELTKPDAGSNVIAISSTARRDGADLLLRGQTEWRTPTG